MLKTEKATQDWDLPHTYQREHGVAGLTSADCMCGRHWEDPLHKPQKIEQASHQAPLTTEKGT